MQTFRLGSWLCPAQPGPRRAWAATIVMLLMALGADVSHAQEEPTRAITHVAGDLYRFQNGVHYSVLLVTEAGILATDPINAAAASWLKEAVAEQFGQPIRYVVYSHDHVDHISGGEVFDEDAIIVAHEQAKADIIGEERPTAVPEITFSDRMTIELGGKQVDLIYVGLGHSDNSVVMHFVDERALFAVDFIPIQSLPYRDLADAYFPEWIESIRIVEALDFDILVPAHGPIGTKADATDHRRYLEALFDAVLSAARAGQTLEEMQASITLDEFSYLDQFEAWLPLNIEGMHRQVSLHRRGN